MVALRWLPQADFSGVAVAECGELQAGSAAVFQLRMSLGFTFTSIWPLLAFMSHFHSLIYNLHKHMHQTPQMQ